jgi:hypothetical protein
MSTLSYNEPHKFSAGALALVVHAIFLSLLYFSINWHVKTPRPVMVVEMWDQLPDPVVEVVPHHRPLHRFLFPSCKKRKHFLSPKLLSLLRCPRPISFLKTKKEKVTSVAPVKKTEHR